MLRNPLPRGSIPYLCLRKGLTHAYCPYNCHPCDCCIVAPYELIRSHLGGEIRIHDKSMPRCALSLVQNMPEDFVLRNINGHDLWVSEGEKDSVEIKEHSHVRIRIANIQLQPEKLVCPS